jgi:MarR family transcriptional regulator, lower aerobic nicotinate degradation pathway regulator
MSSRSTSFDLNRAPGHLIRRAHQIVVALFLDQTQGLVTPVQFAVLATLAKAEPLSQATLAERAGLDVSTTGTTLERMQAKGWIERRPDGEDRRRRRIAMTPAARALYREICEDIERVHDQILQPLDKHERAVFMTLLTKLVEFNNENSRVPVRSGGD